MEYVQGESLARLYRELQKHGGGVPIPIVASIITNVLYGLHAAHEAVDERGHPLRLFHSDVSPQNILVGSDGVARVLDFGVAKAAGRLQTTREGQIKGKLSYMAPEQLGSAAVDRRVDVYAISVVMWEALTSRRLFDGENEAVVFGQVLNAPVPPPSSIRAEIPFGLDRIVLHGLSRNPARRFATAHDMAVAIEEAVAVASPRVVGGFVTQVAGASLARRAARVKEIESFSSTDAANALLRRAPTSSRDPLASHPGPPDPAAAPRLSKLT